MEGPNEPKRERAGNGGPTNTARKRGSNEGLKNNGGRAGLTEKKDEEEKERGRRWERGRKRTDYKEKKNRIWNNDNENKDK